MVAFKIIVLAVLLYMTVWLLMKTADCLLLRKPFDHSLFCLMLCLAWSCYAHLLHGAP